MARDRDDQPDDTETRGGDRPERDEERPRKRRRRDEDFDDRDAAPRKKSNTTMIVLVIVGVFGLFTMVCGGLAIGLLLPAVQKVREAAARATSSNNLMQIDLAMLGMSDANGVVYGPVAMDDFGKPNPNMSFRVGLLPYMGFDVVYKSIDLTKPWDSGRNSTMTSVTLTVFQDPGFSGSTNQTPYRAFVGGGAFYPGDGAPVQLMKITDGTSNTIFMVQATETVPWAKPQELPYGKGIPLPKLGSPGNPSVFLAAFADGSVRPVNKSIPEADLRSLIETNDGRLVIIP